MKKIIWVALTILLVSFTVKGNTQTSYAVNFAEGLGGFETDWDNNGLGDGWTFPYKWSFGVTPSLDKTTYLSGKSSQKISFNIPNSIEGSLIRIQNNLTAHNFILPGKQLTLSFKLKTSAITNLKFSLFIDSYDTDGNYLGKSELSTQPVSSGLNWQLYTYTWTVPANATKIAFNMQFLAIQAGLVSGNIWVDNYVVSDGSSLLYKKYMIKNWLLYSSNLNVPYLSAMTNFEGGLMTDDQTFIGWQEVRPDGLNALKSHVVYTRMDATISTPSNVFTWAEINSRHPEWLLTDINGDLLKTSAEATLDIGSSTYQQEWLSRTLDYLSRMNVKWVFIDWMGPEATATANGAKSTKYPTDASWIAANTSFLNAVVPGLHQAGYKVMLNMFHAPWYTEPGKTWIGLTDGALYELGYTIGLTKVPYIDWKNKFLSQVYNSNKVFATVERAPVDDMEIRRFGLASYLLGYYDKSYYLYCLKQQMVAWNTDLEVDLGAPISSYGISSGDITNGGLFYRGFEKGIVLCNPTDTQTFTYTLTRNYKDLDGHYISPGICTLLPKQSLILLTQPDLNLGGLEITFDPPTIIVPKGGQVTVKVTLKNTFTPQLAVNANGNVTYTINGVAFTTQVGNISLQNITQVVVGALKLESPYMIYNSMPAGKVLNEGESVTYDLIIGEDIILHI